MLEKLKWINQNNLKTLYFTNSIAQSYLITDIHSQELFIYCSRLFITDSLNSATKRMQEWKKREEEN